MPLIGDEAIAALVFTRYHAKAHLRFCGCICPESDPPVLTEIEHVALAIHRLTANR
jgi:hypothetical protein